MTRQEYDHAYWIANRERKSAQQRAWYVANRERILADKRKYWEDNKEEIKPKQRARNRAADKQKRNEYVREYRKQPHVKAKRHEEHRRYAERYPEKRRNKFLREKYGIGLLEYNEMLASQGGVCAICKEPPIRVLDVDHHHETNVVRELLCRRCNAVVGSLESTVVEQAREYLRKWSNKCL